MDMLAGLGGELLRKRTCWLVVAGALLLVLILFAELTPSVLAVHGDLADWRTVEVKGFDVRPPLIVRNPGSVVHVSLISHGEYSIKIVYSDGTTVWATYFHLDAGARRRVDVYAERVPGGDTVQLRCVVHNWPVIFGRSVIPGRSETLFDGSVQAGKTSSERPLILSSV
jgi:hypothetical protein